MVTGGTNYCQDLILLAVLTSHPIQYQAPLWREINNTLEVLPVEVWFLTPHGVEPSFDREFDQTFKWDQDLLSGYSHRFLDILPDWKMNQFRGVKLAKTWEAEFKEHKVTHLWVEGWRFLEFFNAIKAANRLGIKVLMRGETNDLRPRNRVKDIFRRMFLSRLFAKVNFFLVIGSANRRFYESFGIQSDRFYHAPYCVDNVFFANEAKRLGERREFFRRKWGIPEGSYCFLFCGKFIDKKRVLDIVEAAKNLDSSYHILFVGAGQLESTLRHELNLTYDYRQDSHEKLAFTSVSATASIVGFLNQLDISKAYVAADCLVLPSDAGETWGLVVNEALATGTPAITSDMCGCSEDLIKPLRPEAVFRCGDVEGIVSAMQAVKSNPPTVAELKSMSLTHGLGQTVKSLRILLEHHRS